MFLGGLNPYEQKNPTESRFATNQRIFKQQQQQKGYYLLLHDFINLNQERKISPYLRESGEVHLGVHGILRRKKACAFQHFLEKKTKKPQLQTMTTFSPVTILVNSVSSRRTSFFKVKCQSRTYYRELTYLPLLLNADALLKSGTYIGKQHSSRQTDL